MTYLLHGVVNAGHPLRPAEGELARATAARTADENQPGQDVGDGLDELELIEKDGLAVVARPWGDDIALTDEDAVRHLDVLVQLVRNGPVLPLRLGTLAPDAAAIRNEVLGPEAVQDLRRRLDAIADLVELRVTVALGEDTVQVLFNEDAELRELVARTRSKDDDLAGRVELGQRVAEHLATRRAGLIGGWIGALGELVEGTASLASSDEGWEQVAFLVRRDRLDEMDAAVAQLAQQVGARARLEYVGPLPIYSFDDIEAAALPAAPQESRWGW